VKRFTALASTLAVLVTVAACSSGTQGFPTPTPGTTSSADGGDSTASSGTTTAGGKIASADQLANTQACDLLPASESSTVGLSASPSSHLAEGAKSGCQWDGDNFSVVVVIRTDVGLAGVLANGGTIVNTNVGSHQAKKLATGYSSGAGGTCLYAIGVTDSLRVDVTSTVVASGDACQESLAVAQLIEPKLP
jgi:hypothetical protein